MHLFDPPSLIGQASHAGCGPHAVAYLTEQCHGYESSAGGGGKASPVPGAPSGVPSGDPGRSERRAASCELRLFGCGFRRSRSWYSSQPRSVAGAGIDLAAGRSGPTAAHEPVAQARKFLLGCVCPLAGHSHSLLAAQHFRQPRPIMRSAADFVRSTDA